QTAFQRTVLNNLLEALRGRRQVPMPSMWAEVYEKLSKSHDGEVRNQSLTLAVVFGDPKAMAELRGVVADSNRPAARRQTALTSLLDAHDKELGPLLQSLIGDPALRGAALRGLAAYDDPQTPDIILKTYATLDPAQKRDAVSTLASRAPY